ELFDPTNNVFLPTVSLDVPRTEHTATLLTNGDVILAGGVGADTLIERVSFTNGQSVVSPAGNLSVPRKGHLATLLPSGEILLAGGAEASAAFAEKFNPDTGLSIPVSASGHSVPAVAVARGKVFSHGWTVQPDFGAEIYDLESNTFTLVDSAPAPSSGEN